MVFLTLMRYNESGGNMQLKIKKLIEEFKTPFILSVAVLIFHVATYYLAKLTPFEAVMIKGRLDDLIPFSPFWVIFYVLWHPLLIITPCLLYKNNKEDFYSYIIIDFIIVVLAIFIFVFYPTIFDRPDLVVNDLFTWILNIVYLNDTPAMNCLPSMHCTVCFTSIYSIVKSNKITKKCKAFTSVIFMLIVLSTVFVKQHSVFDIIAALILTAIVSLIVYIFKLDKKLANKIEKSR